MTEPHSHPESEHGNPNFIPPLDGTANHAHDGMEQKSENSFRPGQYDANPNGIAPNGTLNHSTDSVIKEDTVLSGHYKVLECLRGGMGVVYKCKDTYRKNAFVALKTVQSEQEMTDLEKQRMLDGFNMVHALRHDHIVSANSLDFDKNFRRWFIVMDWIDGEDLETRLSREEGGRLPVSETLRILKQVADALDYAHDEKKGTIVHRDVKCANIMLRKDGEAMLIDFGIAWRLSATRAPDASKDANVTWGNLTAVINPFSGTRGYQSPEQWEGKAVTPASDQYSLAVTAYRCLSGHLPFLNANEGEMQELVLHIDVPKIQTLSAETNAVLAKGMSKDPKDRYESCTEFIDELAKTLAGSGQVVEGQSVGQRPSVSSITEVDFYLYLDEIEKLHAEFEKGEWDRGQTFGAHLDDLGKFWKLANMARNDRSFKTAYEFLQYVEAEWKWIKHNEPLRTEALKRRGSAEQARQDAEPLQPKIYAQALYNDALQRLEEANKRLEQGAFDVAAEGFSSAYEAFTAAGASAAAEHIGQLEQVIAEHVSQRRFNDAKAAVQELYGLDMAKAKEREATIEATRKSRIEELKSFISSELKEFRFVTMDEPLRELAEIDEEEAEKWGKTVVEARNTCIQELEERISDALVNKDFITASETIRHLGEIDEARGTELAAQVNAAKESYVSRLKANISEAIETGRLDEARRDVQKLIAVDAKAAEQYETPIRVRELELSIEKSLSQNDFASAEEAVRNLASIDEAKGAEWAEKLGNTKSGYVNGLQTTVLKAIDEGRFHTAREDIKKLSAVDAEAAEKLEKAISIRELELAVEKSLSENDFVKAEKVVSNLVAVDESKGTEWAEKITQAKAEYASQLQADITVAILQDDFAKAENIVLGLAAIDKSKGAEWAEKIHQEKSLYISKLEVTITEAISEGRFDVARESVRKQSVVDSQAAEKWERAVTVRELGVSIEDAVSRNDFTAADEAIRCLTDIDKVKGADWKEKVSAAKAEYENQLRLSAEIRLLEQDIAKAVEERRFAEAEDFLRKLAALDATKAKEREEIVGNAKPDCMMELEGHIDECIQQSRFKEAREFARQLYDIDNARGEKCESDILEAEEKKANSLMEVGEDAIREGHFTDAHAVVTRLAVLNAEMASTLERRIEEAEHQRIEETERARRRRSRTVRKCLWACLAAAFLCLMVGAAWRGRLWWERKKLVQEIVRLEERLRDYDSGSSRNSNLEQLFNEHHKAFKSHYDKGQETWKEGLLAEARDSFLKADDERTWIEQNLPLYQKAVAAKKAADAAQLAAIHSEAETYADDAYQKAIAILQGAKKELNSGGFEQSRVLFENSRKAFEDVAKSAVEEHVGQLEQDIAKHINEKDLTKAENGIGELERLNTEKAAGWKEKLSTAKKAEEERLKAEHARQLEARIAQYIQEKEFTKAEENIGELANLDAMEAEGWKEKLNEARKAQRISELEKSIAQYIQEKEFTKAENDIGALANLNAAKADNLKTELDAARKKDKVESLLKEAKEAQDAGQWQVAYDKAVGALTLDAYSAEAMLVKTEAEAELMKPRAEVVAMIDGRIVTASMDHDGKTYETPLKYNQLTKGGRLEGSLSCHMGDADYKGDFNEIVDWTGFRQIKVELEKVVFNGKVTLPGGVELKLVKIPAGSFMMGSPENEFERYSDEKQHRVTLTKDYWLGETEVTQKQYEAVMETNPSYFKKGGDYPVETVSWYDAMSFCKKLTELERKAGRLLANYEYSLPTEAQWEYACRAGTTTPWHYGDSLSSKQANFDGNYPGGNAAEGEYLAKTTLVKNYKPNAWGLYDIHGNVWEWCRDSCEWKSGSIVTDTYQDGIKNPLCLVGSHRVYRGGSRSFSAEYCRSSFRHSSEPSYCIDDLGFRVALAPVDSTPSASSDNVNKTMVEIKTTSEKKVTKTTNEEIEDKTIILSSYELFEKLRAMKLEAQSAMKKENYVEAAKIYRQMARYEKNRARCASYLLREADCLMQAKKGHRALEEYTNLLENYPLYVPYEHVVEQLRQLAEWFIVGDGTFLGIKDKDTGIQIYELIIREAPAVQVTLKDRLRLAELLKSSGRGEEAVVVYQAILRQEPNNWDVHVKLALLFQKLSKSGDSDGAKLRAAVREANIVLQGNPDNPLAEDLKKLSRDAEAEEAERLLKNGQFYLLPAHRRPTAARRYMHDVIMKYPDSDAAKEARRLLKTNPELRSLEEQNAKVDVVP